MTVINNQRDVCSIGQASDFPVWRSCQAGNPKYHLQMKVEFMINKEDFPQPGCITTALCEDSYVITIEGNDCTTSFLSVYQMQSRSLVAFKEPVSNDRLTTRIKMLVTNYSSHEHTIEKKSAVYYSEDGVNQFYKLAENQGGRVDESQGLCTKRNLTHEHFGLVNQKLFGQIMSV